MRVPRAEALSPAGADGDLRQSAPLDGGVWAARGRGWPGSRRSTGEKAGGPGAAPESLRTGGETVKASLVV